jgi:hypothetical protein
MTVPWSIALRDIPAPDYADASIVPIAPGESVDPAAWARRIFSFSHVPLWVKAAMGLRQLVVPVIGVRKAPRDVFRIREHGDDEVLIAYDDTHLDFRCGVAVDEAARLLRVTTTVRFHGMRGRLYFWPVRLAHPVVVRSMIRSAARSWHSPAF